MALINGQQGGKPIYRVRWNYRRDEHGKKIYDERRFRNRREAMRFEREVTASHSATTEAITVRQLANKWFSQHVDTDALQQRTAKAYHVHYRKRIDSRIGGKRVAKLTPLVVAEWRDELKADGCGAPTINRTLETLKTMIRWGRSEGLVTNTAVDDVRRLKQPLPKPANPYTPDQVNTIAQGCEHLRDATMIRLAAYSGLRWSELRALEWADIDLDAGTINLTRAIDVDRSVKSTKSDRHRIVPILAPGIDALRAWRKSGPGPKLCPLVFPTSSGTAMAESNWYGQRLPKIREACGISFGLHELRDTYASILIQSGIGEAELTLWLGHRSIQVTISRYAKLFESRKAQLVTKANAALLSL